MPGPEVVGSKISLMFSPWLSAFLRDMRVPRTGWGVGAWVVYGYSAAGKIRSCVRSCKPAMAKVFILWKLETAIDQGPFAK